jgi:hypothetical protein
VLSGFAKVVIIVKRAARARSAEHDLALLGGSRACYSVRDVACTSGEKAKPRLITGAGD